MAQSVKGIAVQVGAALLPDLIQDVENYFGSGNGAEKHAAVIAGVSAVVTAVAGIAPVINPLYGTILSGLINAIIAHRKAAGVPVVADPPAQP